MTFFGLTGNIGCGKSTVASLLATQPGVAVHDCDRISKDIIRSGAHKDEIQTALATDVFSADGVDLAKIAEIIFRNVAKRKALEALIHPLVWERILADIAKDSDRRIHIVESAVFYENGDDKKCCGMIVVTCDPEEQLRRLLTNRRMTQENIDARLAVQLPMKEKEARAQFLIHNDCTIETLRERVEILYRQLTHFQQTGG